MRKVNNATIIMTMVSEKINDFVFYSHFSFIFVPILIVSESCRRIDLRHPIFFLSVARS